jgi:hypothetical protein
MGELRIRDERNADGTEEPSAADAILFASFFRLRHDDIKAAQNTYNTFVVKVAT